MLRSFSVADVNLYSSWSTTLVFWIEKGTLTSLFRLVRYFFGIMKAGAPHSDLSCSFSTPILIICSISFLRVVSCMCRTGKAFPWYGFAPSFRGKTYWVRPETPSESSKVFCNFATKVPILSHFQNLRGLNSAELLLEGRLFL